MVVPCAKGVGRKTEQRDKEEDWDEWLWVEAMEPARHRQHRVLETAGRESGLHMTS